MANVGTFQAVLATVPPPQYVWLFNFHTKKRDGVDPTAKAVRRAVLNQLGNSARDWTVSAAANPLTGFLDIVPTAAIPGIPAPNPLYTTWLRRYENQATTLLSLCPLTAVQAGEVRDALQEFLASQDATLPAVPGAPAPAARRLDVVFDVHVMGSAAVEFV